MQRALSDFEASLDKPANIHLLKLKGLCNALGPFRSLFELGAECPVELYFKKRNGEWDACEVRKSMNNATNYVRDTFFYQVEESAESEFDASGSQSSGSEECVSVERHATDMIIKKVDDGPDELSELGKKWRRTVEGTMAMYNPKMLFCGFADRIITSADAALKKHEEAAATIFAISGLFEERPLHRNGDPQPWSAAIREADPHSDSDTIVKYMPAPQQLAILVAAVRCSIPFVVGGQIYEGQQLLLDCIENEYAKGDPAKKLLLQRGMLALCVATYAVVKALLEIGRSTDNYAILAAVPFSDTERGDCVVELRRYELKEKERTLKRSIPETPFIVKHWLLHSGRCPLPPMEDTTLWQMQLFLAFFENSMSMLLQSEMTEGQVNTLCGCPRLVTKSQVATKAYKEHEDNAKQVRGIIPNSCSAVLREPNKEVVSKADIVDLVPDLRKIVPREYEAVHNALSNPTVDENVRVIQQWLTLALNHLVVCFYLDVLHLVDWVPSNSTACMGCPWKHGRPTPQIQKELGAPPEWHTPLCERGICFTYGAEKHGDAVLVLCRKPAFYATGCKGPDFCTPCPAVITSCERHVGKFGNCDLDLLSRVHGTTWKGSYVEVKPREPSKKKRKVAFQPAKAYSGEEVVEVVNNPLLVVSEQDLPKMQPCEENCAFCLAGNLVLKIICGRQAGGLLTPLGGHANVASEEQSFGKSPEEWIRAHLPCNVRPLPRNQTEQDPFSSWLRKSRAVFKLQSKEKPLTHKQLKQYVEEIEKVTEKHTVYLNNAWDAHKQNPATTTKEGVLVEMKEWFNHAADACMEMGFVIGQELLKK
jgi:hypothetical protein